MRRGMLAALLIGCASPSTGIHGKLLVHTGDPTPYTSVHVLLGDGTQYDLAVDGNGDALFEDSAIRGEQDVTGVWVEAGMVNAHTARAIDHDELWLSPQWYRGKRSLLRTVTGHVLGAGSAVNVDINAAGTTLTGFATAQADGSFSMPLMGTAQGTFDLAAHSHDAQGQLLAAGLVRGLSSTTALATDITLDHPADQSREIDVRGADAYGATSITYYLDHYTNDGIGLFPSMTTSPAATATLNTIDTTPPFDALQRAATANACSPAAPLTCGVAVMPFESSSITLDLLMPAVVSPMLDAPAPDATVPLEGLDFTVTADPSVQYVNLELGQSSGANQVLDWVISMPTSQVEFAPFALPADATPQTLQVGTLEVFVYTELDERMTSYDELWAAVPFAPDYSKDTYREANVWGAVLLQ